MGVGDVEGFSFSDICINTTLSIYYTQNRLEQGEREGKISVVLSIYSSNNKPTTIPTTR